MKNQALPTLADVAKRAKVSTATVSRCLNFPDQVSASTRDRVMSAITELGYTPNFGARVLAAKRTNTIGAIIPTMENAIFARGLQAFQEELKYHGFTLLVASSSYREEIEEEQIHKLVSRGADGLLLIGAHRSDKIYKFLEQRNIPVVLSWVFRPDLNQYSVGFDNCEAMKELTNKIIDLGHKNIAVISASMHNNDRAYQRVLGIKSALKDANIEEQSLTIYETSYGIDEGAEAFKKVIKTKTRPTVILCGNDVLAAGAMRQAKKMGIRIPQDISITGFDDLQLASIVSPSLTTVHVPHRKMGKDAAQILVNLVTGRKVKEKSIKLETTLCIRESLGPVK
ncbi:LacI family DNA-binding transcriptional regulator [Kiloniella sp. EL199]|uniref:LacI family DNA-binding transcriptional regulator n=1 Tax=Kiloniella sp. EL199 TaxID=2107581 RepID=UPI000EA005BA|nr:LacI family DNA-binding transcriptional regulator [Kiloniella sp. EL199]